MSVSIIYSAEAFLHKNKGQEGTQLGPFPFTSREEAKSKAVPEGYAFAVIHDENGTVCDVYSKRLGWGPLISP
jgi:hypothetical protein